MWTGLLVTCTRNKTLQHNKINQPNNKHHLQPHNIDFASMTVPHEFEVHINKNTIKQANNSNKEQKKKNTAN